MRRRDFLKALPLVVAGAVLLPACEETPREPLPFPDELEKLESALYALLLFLGVGLFCYELRATPGANVYIHSPTPDEARIWKMPKWR